jgi:Xaa-Pro aminopeptidase
MYPHQIERLSEALGRSGLKALIATAPANIAYISGFASPDGSAFLARRFAVFTTDGTALVVPALDLSAVLAEGVEVDHVVCFGSLGARVTAPASAAEFTSRAEIAAEALPGPVEALGAALDRLGIEEGAVGLDASRLTHEAWRLLVDGLSRTRILEASRHLAWARRVKGPYEIECLGHALRIAEEALDVVIQTIERGATEREMATLYATEVLKRGGWPYPPVVAVGERTAIPAPSPADTELRPGAPVRFDVGCVHKGYSASLARTAVLGEPAPSLETMYRAVQAGLEAATAAVMPGGTAGRVLAAGVEAVCASGFPRYALDRAGHGIGLERCEAPELGPDDAAILDLGEVLLVEMPYYEPGSIGVAARDTVLVTSAGGRALNRSHHGLITLD